MDIVTNIEYLEFLWRGKLPEYEKFIVRGKDGRSCRPLFEAGVYFLWNRDGLQYIGQSHLIWTRLEQHHVISKKDMGEWIIGVIPVENRRERLNLESCCIKTFRPPKNIKDNT